MLMLLATPPPAGLAPVHGAVERVPVVLSRWLSSPRGAPRSTQRVGFDTGVPRFLAACCSAPPPG
eukprot:4307830-Prymnesium_polylepis.1